MRNEVLSISKSVLEMVPDMEWLGDVISVMTMLELMLNIQLRLSTAGSLSYESDRILGRNKTVHFLM